LGPIGPPSNGVIGWSKSSNTTATNSQRQHY
jgi:hypothetical protein